MKFDIHRIDHVVLSVADMDKALSFYRDLLGCQIDRRQDQIGLVQLRAGDSMIDLLDRSSPISSAGTGAGHAGVNMDHFALRISPFDESALTAFFAARGVEIVSSGQRYGAEGTGPSIYIKDPDGNIVELKGPAQD